eukprot:6201926-Pleurochrysis_carterae.AAC.1
MEMHADLPAKNIWNGYGIPLPYKNIKSFSILNSRPVGLALYGRSNNKSGVTPEAESFGIDAPLRGVVHILMIMRY